MQVLAQPVLLGLALAFVSVLIDSRFKRQRQANVLTIPDPSEYPGSSISNPLRTYPDPIGSEDPTAVRPVMQRGEDSKSSSKSENETAPAPQVVGSSYAEKPQ